MLTLDTKVLVSLIAFAGIFATALLAALGYVYRGRIERQKSGRKILYLLLELRFSLLRASMKPKEMTQAYFSYMCLRLKNEKAVNISADSIPTEIANILEKRFESVIADLRQDLKERVFNPFNETLNEFAMVEPITAYKLKGADKWEKLMHHGELHAEDLNEVIGSNYGDSAISEKLYTFSKKVSRELIDEAITNLENHILMMGWYCSIPDYWRCKKILKNGLNNQNKYDFDDIYKEFEHLITELIYDVRSLVEEEAEQASS